MGLISGGAGRGVGPSVLLTHAAAIDAKALGTHPISWTAAFDNSFDVNPLAALPAGLGVTVAIDGSDPGLTFTVAGVWAAQLAVGAYPASDATFSGYVSSQFAGSLTVPLLNGPGATAGGDVFAAPAGGFMQYRILTATAATGASYNVSSFQLSLVRLA